MKLETIARAYTDCIELESRIQRESPGLADDISILRADLHGMLMEALRESKIPFSDRAQAAQIAYDIVQGKLIPA